MNNGNSITGRRFPRLVIVVLPATAVLFVAALWRFTPLSEMASPETIRELMRAEWTTQWWSVLCVMAVYIIANSVLFPNSILNIAVILGVGGYIGWLYAICGSLSAATVFFFVGRFWIADTVTASHYSVFLTIKNFMAKGGLAAVVAVHSVPTAPYGVVNAIIGTFNITFRAFIVGTFIGHLPGTLCLAVFGTHLANMFEDPPPHNVAILILMVCAAAVLVFVLRKRVKSHADNDPRLDSVDSGS